MQAVKAALRAKAIADSGITTALGGQNVLYGRPKKATTFPLLTFFEVFSFRDKQMPIANELYQFDAWAKTADKADEITEAVITSFDRKPLTITGRRLLEIFHEPPLQEFYEEDEEIHHKMIQIRIISVPA